MQTSKSKAVKIDLKEDECLVLQKASQLINKIGLEVEGSCLYVPTDGKAVFTNESLTNAAALLSRFYNAESIHIISMGDSSNE